MPELTWTAALTWFGVLAGAASVAALVFGWIGQRQTTRLQADIHAATQSTLQDMRKGFSESQQTLGQILERLDGRLEQADRRLEQADRRLEQADRRSEQLDRRWQEAFERMDQRADERHREVLQAMQALKG